MNDSPDILPHDEDDFLAAEMALGLTEGEALSAAQGRLNRDAPFAALVAGWQERFVAMTNDIDPVAPPKRAKKKLLAHLFPKVRVPLMQRLWVWKGISLAAILLLAYVAMPLLRPTPDAVPPQIYATRMSGESTLELLAVVDASQGDIALRRTSGGAPDGRVLELWAILPEQAPISLGILPADEVTRVALPEALLPQITSITFAITDEPPGGGPNGAPSGNIMATGVASAL